MFERVFELRASEFDGVENIFVTVESEHVANGDGAGVDDGVGIEEGGERDLRVSGVELSAVNYVDESGILIARGGAVESLVGSRDHGAQISFGSVVIGLDELFKFGVFGSVGSDFDGGGVLFGDVPGTRVVFLHLNVGASERTSPISGLGQENAVHF